MQHVKKISGNLRQGCDCELSPCTALIGKNRSGKSTIIDAVSLALVGEAFTPGIKKAPAELLRLIPPDADQLKVQAIMDDDTPIDWVLSGAPKAKMWRRQDGGELPAAVFPYEAARAVLYGQPKKVRQAVIDSAGAVIPYHRLMLTVESAAVGHLLAVFEGEGIELARMDNGAVEPAQTLDTVQVGAALEAARKKRLDREKEVKHYAQEMGSGEVVFSEADETELADLSKKMEFLVRIPLDRERAGRSLAELTTAHDELAAQVDAAQLYTQEQEVRYQREAEGLSAMGALLDFVIADLRALHERTGQADATVLCAMCGTAGHTLASLVTQRGRLRDAVDSAKGAVSFVTNARRSRTRLERELVESLEKIKAVESAATQGFVPTDDSRARHSELSQRKAQAGAAAVACAQRPGAEQEAKSWAAVEAGLKTALEMAVEGATGTIDRRMNEFLPKSTRARISSDGQRLEIAQDNGDYHDFRVMSGADRVELAIAFAIATIQTTADRPVRLLVLDEAGLDPRSSKTLMKCLAQHVVVGGGITQVLLSLLSLSGQLPDGWTAVRLDKAAKQTRKKTAGGKGAEKEPKAVTEASTPAAPLLAAAQGVFAGLNELGGV